jgi:hypothetical protein
MDFLQANWFSLLAIAAYVVDRIITRAKRDEKIDQLIRKMAETEAKMERAITTMDAHIANPDIHVNTLLLKLFDERFESMIKEQSETRIDVQRIESMLTNMR